MHHEEENSRRTLYNRITLHRAQHNQPLRDKSPGFKATSAAGTASEPIYDALYIHSLHASIKHGIRLSSISYWIRELALLLHPPPPHSLTLNINLYSIYLFLIYDLSAQLFFGLLFPWTLQLIGIFIMTLHRRDYRDTHSEYTHTQRCTQDLRCDFAQNFQGQLQGLVGVLLARPSKFKPGLH